MRFLAHPSAWIRLQARARGLIVRLRRLDFGIIGPDGMMMRKGGCEGSCLLREFIGRPVIRCWKLKDGQGSRVCLRGERSSQSFRELAQIGTLPEGAVVCEFDMRDGVTLDGQVCTLIKISHPCLKLWTYGWVVLSLGGDTFFEEAPVERWAGEAGESDSDEEYHWGLEEEDFEEDLAYYEDFLDDCEC